MKIIHLRIIIAVLLTTTMIFQACERNAGEISSEDSAIVQDDALGAELFEDIFNETDLILEDQFSGLKGEREDTCKTVTMEKLDSETRKITIDYGIGNCEDFHGRIKKGKIVIIASGKYRNEGFTRTITFKNFYVNDFRIEGTKTVTNEGVNDNDHVTYSVKLENGKITTPKGKEIRREFEKTREWIKGYNTPLYKWDNEYHISGTITGTTRNGVNYTRTINDPLYVSATCRHILAGTAEIEREEKPTILIDYGDGECDAVAMATIEGKTKEIRLRR